MSETTPQLPKNLCNLVAAMEFIEAAREPAYGGLFAAIVEREFDELQITDSLEATDNPLAAIDTGTTQKASLSFDQSLGILAYTEALDAAGLQLGADPFNPHLTIANGEQFGRTLATMPREHAALRKGVEDIVGSALIELSFPYWAAQGGEDLSWLAHPTFRSEVVGDESALSRYQNMLTELLVNTPNIADGLRNLDVTEHLILELEQARIAYAENMLPYWAIAHRLGLYQPATTCMTDLEWTQLHGPEDWVILDKLLESALKRAPAGSRFMQTLVATLLSNVQKLQNGQLEPSKSKLWEDDDPEEDYDDYDEPDDDTPEGYTTITNPTLKDVVKKLQNIQAWL